MAHSWMSHTEAKWKGQTRSRRSSLVHLIFNALILASVRTEGVTNLPVQQRTSTEMGVCPLSCRPLMAAILQNGSLKTFCFRRKVFLV